MSQEIKILFLGDVIGKPGRRAVLSFLKENRGDFDFIICNVENAAHGFGVQEAQIQELEEAGVHVFSGGNHSFDRKEIFDFIDTRKNVLRPANYPDGTPGRGHFLGQANGHNIAVLNLQGRVFMEPLQSPFLIADRLLEELSAESKIIFVDIHAEATAEKVALGWYLDGRVSAVVGTHTHVQTADERILPGGTAYLTDAGACGPMDGVIGMERKSVMRRLVEQLPSRLEVAEGPAQVCGMQLKVDATTGKAIDISRIRYQE